MTNRTILLPALLGLVLLACGDNRGTTDAGDGAAPTDGRADTGTPDAPRADVPGADAPPPSDAPSVDAPAADAPSADAPSADAADATPPADAPPPLDAPPADAPASDGARPADASDAATADAFEAGMPDVPAADGPAVDVPVGACRTNAECGATEYCEHAVGACDGFGACAPRPGICPAIFAPVCGCNGTTYSNACRAASAGENVAHTGSCP